MPGRRTRRRTAEIDEAEIKHWEYALTCPLPPWTIYEDLQIRRADVLSYLEFLTHDLAQGDPERARNRKFNGQPTASKQSRV